MSEGGTSGDITVFICEKHQRAGCVPKAKWDVEASNRFGTSTNHFIRFRFSDLRRSGERRLLCISSSFTPLIFVSYYRIVFLRLFASSSPAFINTSAGRANNASKLHRSAPLGAARLSPLLLEWHSARHFGFRYIRINSNISGLMPK